MFVKIQTHELITFWHRTDLNPTGLPEFVPGKPFQPSLMFVGKARGLP